MADIETEIIHKMMDKTKNIRNMSVIAHVDHGKSTLTDCLLIKARIAGKDGNGERLMDTRKDEKERGITIKSTAVSMRFAMQPDVLEAYTEPNSVDGNEFLINLIDSPGHVDFSSEVTAALRITDGALVVVDCVDGICVQTETVLRQAVEEFIVPTLVLNKLDRAMLELEYSPKELYEVLKRRIESFNCKLQSILGDKTYVRTLDPGRNEISFCSGLQGWGFTLNKFARFYLKHSGKHTYETEKKFTEILWSFKHYVESDNLFDAPKIKSIKGGAIPEGRLTPFEFYVLKPLYEVRDLCMAGKVDEIIKYLTPFGVTFKNVELTGSGKSLFKLVFKTWLPAADTLLEQIVTKLPSPVTSQNIRADYLYTGKEKDDNYHAIRACNTSRDAPLVIYISKMLPDNANGFVAFGRVFSGRIQTGDRVFVQDPEYVPGADGCNTHVVERTITKVQLVTPRGFHALSDCCAGNIVGICGVEGFLKKTGTIASRKHCHNIKTMKFSVNPVVKVAVAPKFSSDLNKFKEGLEKLGKSDPLCVIEYSELGQATIACAGELHLEIILYDLKEEYAKCEFITEKPQIKYYEGFQGAIEKPKMRKSANKHNRVYMTCEPLEDAIVDNIPNLIAKDPKQIAANFREILQINEDWVKNIMFFAPEEEPLNILVDETKGIQYMAEVKEHIFEGFKLATKEGPIIGEGIRAGRFNLVDLSLHADSIHRGANQMIRPVEDLVRGLVLHCDPVVYEPIYLCTITTPSIHASSCEAVIKERRGLTEEWLTENTISTITGYVPVNESWGFDKRLKEVSKGQATFSFVVSHYAPCPGALDKPKSPMFRVVEEVRKYKKITSKLEAEEYFDTL